jgi:hypothetical protein
MTALPSFSFPFLQLLRLDCGSFRAAMAQRTPITVVNGIILACPSMTHFTLDWCSLRSADQTESIISSLPKKKDQLQSLKLDNCGVTDVAISALSSLPSSLRALSIDSAKVTSRHSFDGLGVACNQLTSLSLRFGSLPLQSQHVIALSSSSTMQRFVGACHDADVIRAMVQYWPSLTAIEIRIHQGKEQPKTLDTLVDAITCTLSPLPLSPTSSKHVSSAAQVTSTMNGWCHMKRAKILIESDRGVFDDDEKPPFSLTNQHITTFINAIQLKYDSETPSSSSTPTVTARAVAPPRVPALALQWLSLVLPVRNPKNNEVNTMLRPVMRQSGIDFYCRYFDGDNPDDYDEEA